MAQIIEIDNGLVSVIERSVRAQVPLDQWLPRIERRLPQFMPALPTGTRAVWWDPTSAREQKFMLLVEREPTILNMEMAGDQMRRLALPWTRWFFYMRTNDPSPTAMWSMEDYRIFWAKQKYFDPEAKDMIRALLPNVYEDGRICFGSTAPNAAQSMADRIDQIINEFNVSRFNHDLTISRPNNWRGWNAWVAATVANPMCWTTWPDWDGRHNMYSWSDLAGNFARDENLRTDRAVAADPIPDLALGATFGRINEWLGALPAEQVTRLAAAVNAYLPSVAELVVEAPEEDENDA